MIYYLMFCRKKKVEIYICICINIPLRAIRFQIGLNCYFASRNIDELFKFFKKSSMIKLIIYNKVNGS